MSEQRRGCGFRRIGGLYLVCDPGFTLDCDGLPLPLEPCGCCGFVPPFSRNLQRIQAEYINQAEEQLHYDKPEMKEKAKKNPGIECSPIQGICTCPPQCPICHADRLQAVRTPTEKYLEPMQYGLMYVGKQGYTPSSFIKEAFLMGVSKRIPEIPSWLKLGETWILLAHNEVPNVTLAEIKSNGLHTKEPEFIQAIFYAFKPQRIEMPMWKGSLTDEQILILEKHGITPILLDRTIPNAARHRTAKNYEKILEKLLQPRKQEDDKDGC